MTRQDLATAGRLMHGTRWQAGLASDLGVSRRLVGFWASGERPIAAWVPDIIELALRGHGERCVGMASEMSLERMRRKVF